MSGSLGKSKQDSSQQSSFGQDVWGPSGSAIDNLYGQLSSLFTRSPINTSVGGDLQKSSLSAIPAWQSQMTGGPYADMDLAGDLSASLKESLSSPTATQEINEMIMGGAGNDYVDAMKGTLLQDAGRAQDQMLNRLDLRAANAGQSGSSRHGIAQSLGMRDINDALTRNMAGLGYETFDKDLERKLQIAQQADQSTLARQGMMQDMLGSQAGLMERGVGAMPSFLTAGMEQQMMPWRQAESYGNIIGRPTILSSGAGSGSSSGKGFGASGGASKSK